MANIFVFLVSMPSGTAVTGFENSMDQLLELVPEAQFIGLIATIIWIWGAILYAFSKHSPMLKKIGIAFLIFTPLFVQFFFVWSCLKFAAL